MFWLYKCFVAWISCSVALRVAVPAMFTSPRNQTIPCWRAEATGRPGVVDPAESHDSPGGWFSVATLTEAFCCGVNATTVLAGDNILYVGNNLQLLSATFKSEWRHVQLSLQSRISYPFCTLLVDSAIRIQKRCKRSQIFCRTCLGFTVKVKAWDRIPNRGSGL